MSGWIESENRLEKTFVFSTFPEAIAWMAAVSADIEAMNHHPEWTNVYNKVMVRLTTHDAGHTITEKDRELAALLDRYYN